MASLTPGILLKLLEHIGSDTKVAGAHRAAFLQVVGIVPAIAESDHLWPRHGFYIKVSDSAHCVYMSLAAEHDDLILSNKLQLGQLIRIDKLEPGSPVPILTNVCPVSGKHPFVGTPQEISLSDSCDFLRRSVAHHPLGLPPDPSSERRRSLGTDNRVAVVEKPAEKAVSWKCPEFSGSKVYPSPSNKLVPGRRSVERSSWSVVGGAPLAEKADKKDDARVGRTTVVPEFSPVPRSRSVSASPARDYSVRSSLFFEKGSLSGCESAPSTAKGSPDVRRSFQKTTISSMAAAVEASSRYKQVSPGVKRAASVGKVGQRANAEQAKIASNPLRRSVSKRSAGEILMMNGNVSSDEKTTDASSEPNHNRDGNDRKDKILLHIEDEGAVVCKDQESLPEQPKHACRDAKSGTMMSNVSPPRSIGYDTSISGHETNGCSIDALPEALATLGKKALQRRFVASYAASEALQEASATQSIILSLSNFEELCAAARPENPGPVVQEFLSLHRTLLQGSSIANALAESRLNASSALENKDDDVLLDASRKARIILDERGQSAISWVNAALSSGLSPCPSWNTDPLPPKSPPPKEKFDGKCCKNKMGSFNSPARGLSKPPCFPLSSANSAQDRPLMSPSTTKAPEDEGACKKSKTMGSECYLKASLDWEPEKNKKSLPKTLCAHTTECTKGGAHVLLDWAKGYGCIETSMLAKQLQEEAEAWFLRFIEKALDSGYKVTIREAAARKRSVAAANNPWPDDNQISAVLSDLKSVNDWLDHIIASRRKSLNPGLEETTTRLKQKLYDLLIQLVLRSPCQMVPHNLCAHNVEDEICRGKQAPS